MAKDQWFRYTLDTGEFGEGSTPRQAKAEAVIERKRRKVRSLMDQGYTRTEAMKRARYPRSRSYDIP